MIHGFVAASVSLLLQAASAIPSSVVRPPSSAQLDVRTEPASVTVRQLTYTQPDGSRNPATLVVPADSPSAARTAHPAILYLHWYEPPRPTSNRTEFLAEAIELAQSGVVSLLVDTPWTADTWFPRRDASHDYEFTMAMTKTVRRAIDVLLAQPGIDASRVALVGHDFGAMWGALAAAEDPRVTHLVYMAGTRSFSDWYLFTPKKEGPEKEAFIAKMAPLDPIVALGRVSPRPVLLQFGTKDQFVKNDAAQAMADAVTGPKTVKTYEFEHELTYQARVDRLAWLRQQLRLPQNEKDAKEAKDTKDPTTKIPI
jgi:cephalosporin-C deacetylase-like acetyl esterase